MHDATKTQGLKGYLNCREKFAPIALNHNVEDNMSYERSGRAAYCRFIAARSAASFTAVILEIETFKHETRQTLMQASKDAAYCVYMLNVLLR